MKRKWKIENSDKEEVQFQTPQKAPARRAYEERKNFRVCTLFWTKNSRTFQGLSRTPRTAKSKDVKLLIVAIVPS